LRDRLEDLPLLVQHFGQRLRPGNPPQFTAGALATLATHRWPGNIRELANLVERLAILGRDPVEVDDVRLVLPAPRAVQPADAGAPLPPLSDALDDYERGLIAGALARADGNVAEAARLLQTDRANLYRRMRRLGLREERRGGSSRVRPPKAARGSRSAVIARARQRPKQSSAQFVW
jgi:DNA-binding NtrC family response regulator